MRTKLQLLSMFTLLWLLSVAAVAENEPRDVPSFSEISLRISGTLYLEQGERQSVRIEASPSTLEEIVTEVKDRTLIIRFKSNNFFRRSFNPGKIQMYVTVPDIDALSVAGSGNIESKDIQSRILDLAVTGSGNITIGNLDSERVKATVSGSGNIGMDQGQTNELNAIVSGSGNIRAAGFEVADATVTVSGSGNCALTAEQSLKARVSGSGTITYNGNPQLDTAVSGSGKVKKR